jgi:hypothetical protein
VIEEINLKRSVICSHCKIAWELGGNSLIHYCWYCGKKLETLKEYENNIKGGFK